MFYNLGGQVSSRENLAYMKVSHVCVLQDEDPQNAWLYLHENDIVAVLKQLPMAAIFRHVFFVTQSQYQGKTQHACSCTTVCVSRRKTVLHAKILS